MLKLLLPKEAGFFGFFKDLANLIEDAAREFNALLTADPSQRANHGQRIKQLEHSADEITHRTMTMLHKTFITPIDREDIHVLIKRLDDIMDFLDAAAQRIVLYNIGAAPAEMVKMTEINTSCVGLVKNAVALLHDLRNATGLNKICVDINRLENEADSILRGAVAKLFSDEPDVRQIIKLKEIYELLETVTDRCEDVANIIEGMVIEYS